jgi:hypothetical protein
VLEISFQVNPEMLGIPDLILEFERESLAAPKKTKFGSLFNLNNSDKMKICRLTHDLSINN